MRTATRILLAAALAASAAGARAQDAAPTLQEDPRAAKFKDVERGFFVGFELGALGFTKTTAQDPNRYPYAADGGGASGGLLVGVNVGVDLGSHFALSAFFMGGNERASVNYGAFSVYALGLDGRFSFYSLRDRNGYERFYVYAHARSGVARSYPAGLFGDREVYFAIGPGIEYFTHLRHFSIGMAADLAYAAKAKAPGYAVYPTVRYTF